MFLNHVSTDVSCTSYQFITTHYSHTYWRVYDRLLLILALLHGMNGLQIVIDGYVRTQEWRIRIESLLALVVLALFMVRTFTLIIFRPVAGSQGPHCIKEAVLSNMLAIVTIILALLHNKGLTQITEHAQRVSPALLFGSILCR
ncbi:MAG: hypothetical protein ACXVDN_15160 [Ktedonobacteraceae bacterium]